MTVEELIVILKQLPDDTEVGLRTSQWTYMCNAVDYRADSKRVIITTEDSGPEK